MNEGLSGCVFTMEVFVVLHPRAELNLGVRNANMRVIGSSLLIISSVLCKSNLNTQAVSLLWLKVKSLRENTETSSALTVKVTEKKKV